MGTIHSDFKAPADAEAPIWRYMDFTKFVWMLEKQALYFARADKMEDPFEGSYPKRNRTLRAKVYRIGEDDPFMQTLSISAEHARKWAYLSCWHYNAQESAAMWQLYSKSSESIAIRSTYRRLFDCLPKDIFVGQVQYIDYNRHTIPEASLFAPFLFKRQSFSHEQEVRALWFNWPIEGKKCNLSRDNPSVGQPVSIDLKALIDAIYVSPSCPLWFNDLVRDVTAKYALPIDVTKSDLNDAPFF